MNLFCRFCVSIYFVPFVNGSFAGGKSPFKTMLTLVCNCCFQWISGHQIIFFLWLVVCQVKFIKTDIKKRPLQFHFLTFRDKLFFLGKSFLKDV